MCSSDLVLPEQGDPVTYDGRVVGRITSVARHHVDGPIALAVIKRSIPVDATLVVGDIAAAQTPIVTA